MVILPFLAGFFLSISLDDFTPVFYLLFALVGFGWAFINVNSLPMVVEMCREGDIGKFTGAYYTFSMSAQIITPILSGWLLKHVGYATLFPYAAFSHSYYSTKFLSPIITFFSTRPDNILTVKHNDF